MTYKTHDRYQCSDPHDHSLRDASTPGAVCSVCGACEADGAEITVCPGSVNGECPDGLELCERHLFSTADMDGACQKCNAIDLAYIAEWCAS